MGLTYKKVKEDCRNYLNMQQRSFLTSSVLATAINNGRTEWADFVRYPRAKPNPVLVALINTTYVDVSSLNILDIEAVYFSSSKNRLHPRVREDLDIINNSVVSVVVATSTTSTPTGYYWDSIEEKIYFYSSSGTFSVTANTDIPIYYTPLPILYAEDTSDDARELEMPTQYCYHLKYFVAAYVYQRSDDDTAALRELAKWKDALQGADTRLNKSKRDYPKVVRDGLHALRQTYKDTY